MLASPVDCMPITTHMPSASACRASSLQRRTLDAMSRPLKKRWWLAHIRLLRRSLRPVALGSCSVIFSSSVQNCAARSYSTLKAGCSSIWSSLNSASLYDSVRLRYAPVAFRPMENISTAPSPDFFSILIMDAMSGKPKQPTRRMYSMFCGSLAPVALLYSTLALGSLTCSASTARPVMVEPPAESTRFLARWHSSSTTRQCSPEPSSPPSHCTSWLRREPGSCSPAFFLSRCALRFFSRAFTTASLSVKDAAPALAPAPRPWPGFLEEEGSSSSMSMSSSSSLLAPPLPFMLSME
ncbi:hypothetical protein V8C86DRAFT_2930796 [Haematococcus lacustris]